MNFSLHQEGCPRLTDPDPDLTCPCPMRWLPDEATAFPAVDMKALRADIGDAGIRRLRLAGKLKRHPRHGHYFTPESL